MTVFDQIADLPEALLPAFAQVVALANAHIDTNTTQFKCSALKSYVDSQSYTDIGFYRMQGITITTEDSSMEDLASKVLKLVSGSEDSAVVGKELAERLKLAFTRPDEAASNGALTHKRTEHGNRGSEMTSWVYRVVYAFTGTDDGFYSVIATVE